MGSMPPQPPPPHIIPQKPKKPHIKKPLNAFMLFMKEQRAQVVSECTLRESAAINQILGRKWHELERADQAKYYEMARQERLKHMQEHPGWSARDNYGLKKKRRRKREKVIGENGELPRKCRARYGLHQINLWCKPCRRKKKCIRFAASGDDPNGMQMGNPNGVMGHPGVIMGPNGQMYPTNGVFSNGSVGEGSSGGVGSGGSMNGVNSDDEYDEYDDDGPDDLEDDDDDEDDDGEEYDDDDDEGEHESHKTNNQNSHPNGAYTTNGMRQQQQHHHNMGHHPHKKPNLELSAMDNAKASLMHQMQQRIGNELNPQLQQQHPNILGHHHF